MQYKLVLRGFSANAFNALFYKKRYLYLKSGFTFET